MSPLLRLALLAAVLPSAALATEVAGASPRSMFLELKLSPYLPDIDHGFATGTGPYYRLYGGGPMLLGELEFDYQFFQKFGSLGVAASVGYAEKYAKAFNEDGVTRSTEAAGLHVLPIKVLLTYRFDWLFAKFDIPLVPYLKAGPMLMPWWSTKGNDIEVSNGLRGAGYKLGVAGVAGLALSLDFLDPRLARDFDTSMGVNHTYLFAEWTYQRTTLFEFNKDVIPLDLDSMHWMFGLGLEF